MTLRHLGSAFLITLMASSIASARQDVPPAASAALPALQRALSDPSPDVRKFAQNAIEKISRKTP